jgi:hypothetical protein
MRSAMKSGRYPARGRGVGRGRRASRAKTHTSWVERDGGNETRGNKQNTATAVQLGVVVDERRRSWGGEAGGDLA